VEGVKMAGVVVHAPKAFETEITVFLQEAAA